MTRRYLIFWILSIAALSIVGRHCSGDPETFKVYFRCEAIAWSLAGVLMWHLTCIIVDISRDFIYVMLAAAFIRNLTLINLLDEFSQSPGKYEIWEYIAGGLAFAVWLCEVRAATRKKSTIESDAATKP